MDNSISMHGKTHKSTTNLLENDIELFKVYRVDNKIRLGSNIDGGYVIGHLDILYDGYITAGIAGNDDFTVDFLNKYNVNLAVMKDNVVSNTIALW